MANVKHDRNGVRTPTDVIRRHKLGLIEPTAEEVEELKSERVVDSSLSTTSTNPVENRAITTNINSLARNLGNKIDKVEGKGLSTNDFTNEYKEAIDDMRSETKSSIVIVRW